MQLLAEPHGGRRLALLAGAMILAMLVLLGVAARARATENLYWDNYQDEPVTIGSSDMTGSGGGLLNLSGLQIEATEGMAYDPVTNRLYIGAEMYKTNEGVIAYVNLDGSGAGLFSAPGLVANAPEGIVIDPATRMMYWTNDKSNKWSISWAKLDGSAAGSVNVAGAATEDYYRLALDPASGRLYWRSRTGGGTEQVISWASVNNTGGGILPADVKSLAIHGLATDPLNNRLYIIGGNGSPGTLSSVGLDGGPVETLSLATAHSPYGLAIDPVAGIAYWGNYGLNKVPTEAIGSVSLAGVAGGGISPATTPTNGPQDPVIVRSPTGTGAPQVTQAKAALSCSQGTWAPDYAGAFLYQAPVSYSYQWFLNGQPVAGATAASFTATTAGSYTCAVTGKNPTGTATQTSTAAATVAPAKLALTLKTKKVKAKAGKTAIVKLKIANGGDVASVPLKVCAKLTKKAKEGLVAPKCAAVKAVGSGRSAVATLKVKTKGTAGGAYKFTAKVKGKGVSAKGVTVHVKVTGA